MCRSCGSIVGAGAKVCGVCGVPAGQSAPQATNSQPQMSSSARPPQPHDNETMRFARAVLTRPATFTFVFLAVNVFIFLLMTFSGAGGSENPLVLRAYGAKFNTLINAGEWWRLVTPVFLHIGYLHLLVNMYSLFILGPYVERLYGSAKFVFFWVATGIAGVAASYFASGSGMHAGPLGGFLFRGGDGPSAGASGALFGLIGVLFVFGIKFRHELPDGFKRAFGTGMIPTILINLFIGYSLPFIDNAAHLGGFAAGALLALCVSYKRPGESAGVAVFWHALQFAALALVVVSFGQVARHLDGMRPDFSNPGQTLAQANVSPVQAYVEAVNEGQQAFHAALAEHDANAASRAIEKLEHAPAFAPQPDEFRMELKQLLVRARDFAGRKADDHKGAEMLQQQRKQLDADFAAWEQRADGWVKTDGKNYGIGLESQETPASSPANPSPAQ